MNKRLESVKRIIDAIPALKDQASIYAAFNGGDLPGCHDCLDYRWDLVREIDWCRLYNCECEKILRSNGFKNGAQNPIINCCPRYHVSF